ncbi:MAG: cation:proton antiporter [Anaerolineales bacterium]|nr:cation:proton antiporter [Anaerolineales bacterium]
MSEVLQFFLALGLMIAFAKIMGYFSIRLGQSAVLGELVAGVILGPSILNLLNVHSLFANGESVEHTLIEVAEVGVLFLMFMAGIEIDIQSMLRVARTALLAGSLGVVAPLILISVLGVGFGYSLEASLFLGLVLGATSVSISAQVMLEMDVIESREGLALLGAAVADDVLVILLISLYLAINPGGVVEHIDSRPIWEVFLRMAAFLSIGTLVAWYALPYLAALFEDLPISEGGVTIAVVSALLMGFIAEYFGGVAAITGAFIAGVALGRTRSDVLDHIRYGFHSINYGLLVPIFFVSIGLQTNLRLLGADIIPFAVLLAIFAVLSKVIGAGLGSKLSGFNQQSALRVGVGMISRGEVGLIVATIGISSGILRQDVFAAVVFVVLLTTLVTPPLVRWSFAEKMAAPQAAGAD